ncbi:NAD(P)-dependent alcohol dehydrogenase [Paenibacillus eucommiae]|uniref:NADPH:quinone reductase-like Zn-dependent oxidoreductase n=1 Tax=Paenibacillus eucommiae TaxID=1355755 RepID=A0ABS4JCT3_9BACL|nr:NAD(P)-dependent alcohol dehydrogenase [Paenibacillus eucommiae]MBP1996539.1 NADPH:quinone reductase-like Zn-dependent oxidoreductase [Paenibacillus eucommiae]
MKAIVFTKYGAPDVLQLKEVEKPAPKNNEVRIKVHASVVTPSDCAFRKADPVIVRFIYGLRKPKYTILGVEVAGEIDSVGKDVKLFKKGDQVFGVSPNTLGAYAEYMCLPEDKPLALKPVNASYEEAVAVCDGALTALIFLRDTAKIQQGQKVLIHGASGAVGAYAVQLAKYFGAEVTGVCSTNNLELVKSLGAAAVIDYTKEDFTKDGQTYDVIFDAVGKQSFSRCKGSLKQKGIYLSTVPALGTMLQMLWTSKFSSKKAIFTAAGLKQNKENLVFLRELFEARKIKSVIDRRYRLEQTAEAHTYVEKGHKKGNVVITL